MEPKDEHTFYMWLIIVTLICVTVLIGVIIDRIAIYRKLRQQSANFKIVK